MKSLKLYSSGKPAHKIDAQNEGGQSTASKWLILIAPAGIRTPNQQIMSLAKRVFVRSAVYGLLLISWESRALLSFPVWLSVAEFGRVGTQSAHKKRRTTFA
jgi:hypothetical protein